MRMTSIRLSQNMRDHIKSTSVQVERVTGLKISESEIMRSALEKGLRLMAEEFAS